MTNEKNPLTLEWVAETFKSHLEKGCVADPEYFMKGLLEARAAYEQALREEVSSNDPQVPETCDEAPRQ